MFLIHKELLQFKEGPKFKRKNEKTGQKESENDS